MQEILVALIVLAALWFVGKQLKSHIRAFKGEESPCKHCSGSCNCTKKGKKTPCCD